MTPHRQIFDAVKTVLIVEDNIEDYHELVRNLTRENRLYRFTHTTNLKDTLEVMGTQEFDSILLDLGLPDSRGLDTYNTVVGANTHRTPILIRTQYADTLPDNLRGTCSIEVVEKGDGLEDSQQQATDKIVEFLDKAKGSEPGQGKSMSDKLDGREIVNALTEYHEISRNEWENMIEFLQVVHSMKKQFVKVFWKGVVIFAAIGLLGLSMFGFVKQYVL